MYFGVLPRLGRSGSQSDVQYAGVLFADIDGGDDGVAYAAGMLTAAVYPRPDVPVLPRPHIAVRSGGGVHCVPLDTEILTKTGWHKWHEVTPGDIVLGYDRLTGTMKWTKMTGKVLKECDEITHIHNSNFSVRCTPEHRWVGTVKSGHQSRITTENQMFATKDMKSTGRHTIIRSAPFEQKKGLNITEQEAAILGWIASDGCFDGQGSVRISQSDKKFTAEIRFLLMGIPHGEGYDHKITCPDLVTWRLSEPWAKELLERSLLHGEKHSCDWSTFVLSLSDKCRNAFLDAFWKGDGCMNRGQKVIQQNPGKISDAIQLAIFLSGYTPRVSKSKECHSIRYGRPIAQWGLIQDKCEPEPVWCPQTELGTWVMRQGDTITITGNSYWILDAPVALPADEDRLYYKKTLRRFVQAIGGTSPGAHADPACCDPARILRVPGTFNYKQDIPRPVEVLWDEVGRPRFSYDKWRADILPAEPIESVPKQYAPSCVDGFISDGLKNWAKRQIPEGSRHNTLVADARWLIKDCGLSKGDAEALLTMRVAASPGRHPITPKEIEGIVKWA